MPCRQGSNDPLRRETRSVHTAERHIGIRCGSRRNPRTRPASPQGDTAGSSSARRGASRLSRRGAVSMPQKYRKPTTSLRSSRAGCEGCSTAWWHPTDGEACRDRSSTPTRCRPCRTGRSRSEGMTRPARCARIHRARGCARGTRPARCWRTVVLRALPHGPTRMPRRPGRPAPPSPTPPRSAVTCRPTSRTPPRPRTRRARPDDALDLRCCCPDPRADASTRRARRTTRL